MDQSGRPSNGIQHNLVLGRAASAKLEAFDFDSPSDTHRTLRPPKLLPPLSSVPEILFKPDFDIGDPHTFHAVAEIPPSSLSSALSSSPPTMLHDPSILPDSLPLLEKLSHQAGTLERHLVREITRRTTTFFAALSNLQNLQAVSARCHARIVTDIGKKGVHHGM